MTNKFNDAKWRREQLIEGKGYDLAKKYIAKLRQEFRKLSDEELDEFNEEIANAFGYKLESVNELNEANLKKGDKLTFKATSDIWIVQRPHGDGYYVKERGMPQLSWQPKDWLDNMIRAGKVVVEGKINEGHTTTFSKEEMAILHKDGTLEKDGHTYVFTND
tara:strand:- start:259 stop:744 length:486 start_codon:yes stop_codon:yes gene_type:complete